MTYADIKKLTGAAVLRRIERNLDLVAKAKKDRDRRIAGRKLRDTMATLFTYKHLSSWHDDQVRELAEILLDIREEADPREYLADTLLYVNRRLIALADKQKNLRFQLAQAKACKKDPHVVQDLTYLVWCYTDGYYAGKRQLYATLRQMLTDWLSYLPEMEARRRPKKNKDA